MFSPRTCFLQIKCVVNVQGVINRACHSCDAPSTAATAVGCSQRGPPKPRTLSRATAWNFSAAGNRGAMEFLIWTLCSRGRVPKVWRPSEDPTWVPGHVRSWSEAGSHPWRDSTAHTLTGTTAPPACSCRRTLPWIGYPHHFPPAGPPGPHGPHPPLLAPRAPWPPCWGCSMEPHLSEDQSQGFCTFECFLF